MERPVDLINLLVVDDNAADALLVTRLFEKKGYPVVVHTVSDGEAALDYLLRREAYVHVSTPQVVLLDINLPRKSGFEVLEEMRKYPALLQIPVFLLTGSQSEDDSSRAHALGAEAFITKPAEFVDFENLIHRLATVEFPRVLKRALK